MDKPEFNTVYEHMKFEGLAGMEKLRGSLSFQSSPDKGIKAMLMVDYNDLTRDKSKISKRYAFAVVMAFDENLKSEYKRISDKATKAHGRTPKAELEAALEMMSSNHGIMVYADKGLLNDEKLMSRVAKNRHFQSVLDSVNDGEYRTDPAAFIFKEDAEFGPTPDFRMGSKIEYTDREEIEGLVDSMKIEIYSPVSKPDPMAPMHDDWIRHFTMSESSDNLTP